jgi:hypothetical protein
MVPTLREMAGHINDATMDWVGESKLFAYESQKSEEWAHNVEVALRAGIYTGSLHYNALGLQDEQLKILRGYVQHILLLSGYCIGDVRTTADGSHDDSELAEVCRGITGHILERTRESNIYPDHMTNKDGPVSMALSTLVKSEVKCMEDKSQSTTKNEVVDMTGVDYHTRPRRESFEVKPNSIPFDQMALHVTRNPSWDGAQDTIVNTYLTKHKIVAGLPGWATSNYARAIQIWLEGAPVFLQEDEAVVLLCPEPVEFYGFETRDFGVVVAALVAEHRWNSTRLPVKIVPNNTPVMDEQNTSTIRSECDKLPSEVDASTKAAKQFFSVSSGLGVLDAATGRRHFVRSMLLFRHGVEVEDPIIHIPWLGDVKLSSVMLAVQGVRVVNDCLVGICTVESKQKREQIT